MRYLVIWTSRAGFAGHTSRLDSLERAVRLQQYYEYGKGCAARVVREKPYNGGFLCVKLRTHIGNLWSRQ